MYAVEQRYNVDHLKIYFHLAVLNPAYIKKLVYKAQHTVSVALYHHHIVPRYRRK